MDREIILNLQLRLFSLDITKLQHKEAKTQIFSTLHDTCKVFSDVMISLDDYLHCNMPHKAQCNRELLIVEFF